MMADLFVTLAEVISHDLVRTDVPADAPASKDGHVVDCTFKGKSHERTFKVVFFVFFFHASMALMINNQQKRSHILIFKMYSYIPGLLI